MTTTHQEALSTLTFLIEAIAAHYLEQSENTFIAQHLIFQSNLGHRRALRVVPELGHCTHPWPLSVAPFFSYLTLEKFIELGLHAQASLSTLLKMSVDVARGIEALHSMRGGAFSHTDVRADQFVIDVIGIVLLNDLNRGKFASFVFVDGKGRRNVPFAGTRRTG